MSQSNIDGFIVERAVVVCPECKAPFSSDLLVESPPVRTDDVIEADLHRVLPDAKIRSAMLSLCPDCKFCAWNSQFSPSSINPVLVKSQKPMDVGKKYAVAVKSARAKNKHSLDIAFIALNGLWAVREAGESDSLWLELAIFEHEKGIADSPSLPQHDGYTHLIMGELYRQHKQYEKAIQEYDLAQLDSSILPEILHHQKMLANRHSSGTSQLPLRIVHQLFEVQTRLSVVKEEAEQEKEAKIVELTKVAEVTEKIEKIEISKGLDVPDSVEQIKQVKQIEQIEQIEQIKQIKQGQNAVSQDKLQNEELQAQTNFEFSDSENEISQSQSIDINDSSFAAEISAPVYTGNFDLGENQDNNNELASTSSAETATSLKAAISTLFACSGIQENQKASSNVIRLVRSELNANESNLVILESGGLSESHHYAHDFYACQAEIAVVNAKGWISDYTQQNNIDKAQTMGLPSAPPPSVLSLDPKRKKQNKKTNSTSSTKKDAYKQSNLVITANEDLSQQKKQQAAVLTTAKPVESDFQDSLGNLALAKPLPSLAIDDSEGLKKAAEQLPDYSEAINRVENYLSFSRRIYSRSWSQL